MSQIHYLPLTPGFFAILVGIFIIVLILRSVRYAYESLGVTSCAAMFLLFATLVGSMFNVPIAELPPERIVSHEVIHFFGMRYQVPVVTHWAGTVIAVNVGGAVCQSAFKIAPYWINFESRLTLRSGDTLVVRWVDRLGRNYRDVTDTIREFMRRGVVVRRQCHRKCRRPRRGCQLCSH